MQISFFEDTYSSQLKPLTLTRPVWDLRIGILTILEKWDHSLKPDLISWKTDSYLEEVFNPPSLNEKDPCLYINSRFLPSKKLIDKIEALKTGEALTVNDDLVAFLANKPIKNFGTEYSDISRKTELEFETPCLKYLWDLLNLNSDEIESDIRLLELTPSKLKNIAPNNIVNPEKIFKDDSAVLEPGVILMADKGPIYIGKNCVIEAGAIIKGPVAICDNATVKMRARVYDASTIGPHCKVGGEVSNSVFHSYSNKAHDGFAGNSLFGQWCNLGADSNTSNLKNNYDLVKIKDWETKRPYEDGVQFFGTVMGDHSKTSINTMLNTGTVCGVSSNIFQPGFPPKYIRSFTWLDGMRNPRFRLDKALEAMQMMMKRRKIELSPAYQKMMKHLFEIRED